MTLREELMDMLQKRVEYNRENAAYQKKEDTQGILEALRYSSKADATEEILFHVHDILSRHGE